MNILIKISIFSLGVLVLLQIWVSHSMVTQGANLKKIEDLQAKLAEENLRLENVIASTSAYLKIASQSAALGFSSPKTIQYIR